MPKEMFFKETNHVWQSKKIRHFFPRHETCFQTSSIKIVNSFAKIWKCKVLGYAKIVESVLPSLLLCLHSSSNWPLQQSFEMQSTWAFDIWPPHLLPYYIYPCALMQALTFKEQVFCSNAYKQALTTENEKTKSSQASEITNIKNCIDGHKLGTKLTLPWVSIQNQVWHPVQPLCIFFVPNFGFHPLFWPN